MPNPHETTTGDHARDSSPATGSRFIPTEEHLGLLDRFAWFDADMTGCGMQIPDEDDQALAQELCAAGLLENRGASELRWMDEHGEITVEEGVMVPAYRITEAGENALKPAFANNGHEPRP